jgi:hypothetical protein
MRLRSNVFLALNPKTGISVQDAWPIAHFVGNRRCS